MPIQIGDGNGAPRRADSKKKLAQFWKAPTEKVAREVFRWVQANEQMTWHRRYQHLLAWRYMTGRQANPSFNFSVGVRPSAVANWYSRSNWSPPAFNAMAQVDDVLANRIYRNRPFLQVCPIAGDFNARIKSKKLSRWIDATFYDLKIWQLVELCGSDSRMYGTGYLKIDQCQTDKKKIDVVRLIDDEVITDETEASLTDNPRTIAIRIFVNRGDLIDRFGNDDEMRRAIENAPSANRGLYFGSDLDTSDIVALVEAWHIGYGKDHKEGRHVVCINNVALLDEENWKGDHFPIAKLPYKVLSSGWRGQGLAEQVMSLQREIERCMSAYWENVRRMSWPRVAIEAASGVSDAALADKSGGTFRYNKTAPTFFTPEAITRDQFQYLETLIRMVRERVGISDQAAAGMRQPGLSSGLAIEKQAMIDDGRHTELMLHLQDFIEQIGVLLIEAAEKAKPTVRLPGRTMQQIKWEDVEFSKNSYSLRAFPMSNMPQTIAGRQQYIDTLFARGAISRATQMRLEQVPDVDGFQDLVNASKDAIEMSLDHMIEENEYVPPEPWFDLKDALATTQSRYLFEKTQETPQERMDLLLRYMSAIEELVPDQAQAPGMQPMAGVPGNPQAQVDMPKPDVQMPVQ